MKLFKVEVVLTKTLYVQAENSSRADEVAELYFEDEDGGDYDTHSIELKHNASVPAGYLMSIAWRKNMNEETATVGQLLSEMKEGSS